MAHLAPLGNSTLDGKPYIHLANIKATYSKKLLAFPGDWHILKSFQPVATDEAVLPCQAERASTKVWF